MERVCNLYSLENVRSYYVIDDDRNVINQNTGRQVKVWKSVRGYPMVTLQAEGRKRGRNVPMHKLVALAFIRNEPYNLIEHKDDNKLDYRVENLKFSDASSNGKNAFVTGRQVRMEKRFRLTMIDGITHEGTMKELSSATNISRATLYDRVYNDREPLFDGRPKTRRNKVLSIVELK